MATFFPFLPDWGDSNKPNVTLTIPSDVQTSKLGTEQRSTTFSDGEYQRRYELTYYNDARLRNTLIEGKGAEFWIPFPLEPVPIDFDYGTVAPTVFSGSSINPIKGPEWWEDYRIFRTYEELEATSGTFSDEEYIFRHTKGDPTDYQILQISQWNDNYPGLGIFAYTMAGSWLPSPGETQVYYLMDKVVLQSFSETEYTDSAYDYRLVWDSVR